MRETPHTYSIVNIIIENWENKKLEREREKSWKEGEEDINLWFFWGLPRVLGIFLVCVAIGDIQSFHKLWIIVKDSRKRDVLCSWIFSWSGESKEEFLELWWSGNKGSHTPNSQALGIDKKITWFRANARYLFLTFECSC